MAELGLEHPYFILLSLAYIDMIVVFRNCLHTIHYHFSIIAVIAVSKRHEG